MDFRDGMREMAPGELRPKRWQYGLVLAALYALYVRVFLDPSLMVDAFIRFPAFLTTPAFAASFFARSGGPVEYLAAWLAQGYASSWLGALILTAVASALCLALGKILAVLSGREMPWIMLVPATAILVLYNEFGFHLADLVALALATTAAAGHASLLPRPLAARAVAFAVLTGLVYYLVGGVFILFVILCVILEAAGGAGLAAATAYALFALVPPLVLARLLPDVGGLWALAPNTPADRVLPLPEVSLLGLLWGFIVAAAALTALRRHTDATSAKPSPGELRPIWRRALIAAVLVGPVVATAHPGLMPILRAERLVRQGRYEDGLRVARRVRTTRLSMQFTHAVNLALFHCGRLSDEMFSFRQNPAGLLLGMITLPGTPAAQVRQSRSVHVLDCSEMLLELGLVDQAIHEASEAVEWHGPQPRSLMLLADAYLVKDQPATARPFLLALSHSPRWGRRARERLAELQQTGQVRDERLAEAARNQLRQDTQQPDIEFEEQCLALLKANPRNRMAFEYLMNMYLLNRSLDRFMAHVEELGQVGFAQIPRHWQEAIVLWQTQTGKTVGLGGYRLDPGVEADFVRFSSLMGPLQQRGASAETLVGAVGPEFGNTYFFYYVTMRSGEGAH